MMIRDAEPGEREVVVELTRFAYAEFKSVMAPVTWRGLSNAIEAVLANSGPAEIIVATDRDEIVGSVFLYPGGSSPYPGEPPLAEPEFRLLSVPPGHRGHGVGRALVKECIRRSKVAGAKILGLHTSVSFRDAIALYRKMGFVRAPERDFRPGEAEVVEAYWLPLLS
jgi:GNAT superfamily N-acetyltransferase